MLARRHGLPWLVLRADDQPCASVLAHICPHGGGEIERRYAERCACFDDASGAEGTADPVAELGLRPIERNQLIAQKMDGVRVEHTAGERSVGHPPPEV